MEPYQEDLLRLKARLAEILTSGDRVYHYALEAFRYTYFITTQYRSHWNEDKLLADLYKVGREAGLPLFYQEFVSDFWSRYHYDYSQMKKSRRKKERYLALQTKYVKKPHHEKHNKEEDAWRIEKKVYRDKAKSGYRRGPGHYFKKLTSRLARRHCTQLLNHEKWDDLDAHENRHLYVDPWVWD